MRKYKSVLSAHCCAFSNLFLHGIPDNVFWKKRAGVTSSLGVSLLCSFLRKCKMKDAERFFDFPRIRSMAPRVSSESVIELFNFKLLLYFSRENTSTHPPTKIDHLTAVSKCRGATPQPPQKVDLFCSIGMKIACLCWDAILCRQLTQNRTAIWP